MPPRKKPRTATDIPLRPVRQLLAGDRHQAQLVADEEGAWWVALQPPLPALAEHRQSLPAWGPCSLLPAKEACALLMAQGEKAPECFRLAAGLAYGLGQVAQARQALAASFAQGGEARPEDQLHMALLAHEAGEAELAAQWASRAGLEATRAGHQLLAGMAALQEGAALAQMGDADWAEALGQKGLAAIWEAGEDQATLMALVRWGQLQLALGKPKEAGDALAKVQQLARATGQLEALASAEVEGFMAAVALAQAGPEVGALVRRLVLRARQEHRPMALVEALLLQAGLPGSRNASAAALNEAEALAESLGLGRLLAQARALRLRGAPAAVAAPWHSLKARVAQAVPLGLAAVMQEATLALKEALGAERAFLLRTQGFDWVGEVYLGPAGGRDEAFSSGLLEAVLLKGEACFVEDLLEAPHLAQRDSVRALGLRSAVALPLGRGAALVGVLLADSQHLLPALGEWDRATLVAWAAEVAEAMQVAESLEEARRAAAQAQALAQLTLAAWGAPSLEALLGLVGPEAQRLCGAERVALLLGEGLDLVACWGQTDAPPPSLSLARWVAEKGQALHLQEPMAEASFRMADSVQRLGQRSVDLVPVLHLGRAFGVLYTDHASGESPPQGGLQALAHLGQVVGAYLALRQGTEPGP